MTNSEVEKRMRVLSAPIEQQIMMCDTTEDIMMLASVMLTRAMDMYDNTITKESRKELMRSYT